MTGSAGSALQRRLAVAVRDLFPGYFALVMATGIVSVAAHVLDMPRIAVVLLGVNIAAFVVLGLLLLARVVAYPGRVLQAVSATIVPPAANGLCPGV